MPFIPTRDLIEANPANLIIRDVLNPGDTAFDVGAYLGWLTLLMCRLVGPRGRVVAFEADRRSLEPCLAYLQRQGATNYTLVNAAVCDTVATATFFANKTYPHSSALDPPSAENFTAVEVPTLTLDAYIRENNVSPTLIKVDVEGSELRVLEGGAGYIEQAFPALILEQRPQDKRCAEFLDRFGYVGIDAHDYRPFNDREYPPEREVTDVLYFRPGGVGNFVAEAYHPNLVRELISPDMQMSADDKRVQTSAIELEAGRYVLEVDFEPGQGRGMISERIMANGRMLVKNDGQRCWIWGSYRKMPFHLHTRASVTVEYQALEPGALEGLRLSGITIEEFPGLAGAIKINES